MLIPPVCKVVAVHHARELSSTPASSALVNGFTGADSTGRQGCCLAPLTGQALIQQIICLGSSAMARISPAKEADVSNYF